MPLFRVVQGNSPFDIAKKVVMAGFAMTATGDRSLISSVKYFSAIQIWLQNFETPLVLEK